MSLFSLFVLLLVSLLFCLCVSGRAFFGPLTQCPNARGELEVQVTYPPKWALSPKNWVPNKPLNVSMQCSIPIFHVSGLYFGSLSCCLCTAATATPTSLHLLILNFKNRSFLINVLGSTCSRYRAHVNCQPFTKSLAGHPGIQTAGRDLNT